MTHLCNFTKKVQYRVTSLALSQQGVNANKNHIGLVVIYVHSSIKTKLCYYLRPISDVVSIKRGSLQLSKRTSDYSREVCLCIRDIREHWSEARLCQFVFANVRVVHIRANQVTASLFF